MAFFILKPLRNLLLFVYNGNIIQSRYKRARDANTYFGFIYRISLSDRHVEKESLADYIGKKREMFLVQVSFLLCKDSQVRSEVRWGEVRRGGFRDVDNV